MPNANVQILPGQSNPGPSPATESKAGFDYSVTDAFKVGGDALFVGSQYFVGDVSNRTEVAFLCFSTSSASYQVNKTFQIYARADNYFR